MKITEKSYVNRFAILCHVITAVVLFAAYTIEFFNGSRTLSYYAIFSGACLAPVIAEVIIYKVNKESGLVKHIMSICYGGLYVFAVLTSTSSMAYTYAFPMYMAIILYMDIRCCALIATGGLAANVIYVVRYAMNTGYSAAELPDVKIRIAAMVLTGVFMILTCAAVRKVNKFKLEQIQEQSDETSKMSVKVLAATDKMTEYIQETAGKMEKLGESVEHIHDSMSQVSTGSNETAEAVQTQMERTEQIQEHIVKVRDAVEQIEKNINGKIVDFKFRDKSGGWGLKGSIIYQNKRNQLRKKLLPVQLSSYYTLFLDSETYRENCYSCKYAGKKRTGDITLGDYWGVEDEHPEILAENYEKVKEWLAYCLERAKKDNPGRKKGKNEKYSSYLLDTGWHWGEWIEPDWNGFINTEDPGGTYLRDIYEHGAPEVFTSHLSFGCYIASVMSKALGYQKEAEFYSEMRKFTKLAYREVCMEN